MIRIIHVSDIHFWHYPSSPWRHLNKRMVGVAALAIGRAKRFRLERIRSLVERISSLDPDHILITGDLTTTALDDEFRTARTALADWLRPGRVTIIPGNHDRYTRESLHARRFEQYFGEFAPEPTFPWIRMVDQDTGILALDPTRPALSARGRLPALQLEHAKRLLTDLDRRPRRLIVACHYPLDAPEQHRRDLEKKKMINAEVVRDWLAEVGPHLYCCGHIHSPWAFTPERIPDQFCLNSGSPLINDPRHGLPGFLEILLAEGDVVVTHHVWTGNDWAVRPFEERTGFFG